MLQLFNKKSKGFTLVEMLVVVAIIRMLIALVLVRLDTSRQKARDSRRQSEIRQISSAFIMYYDTQSFPGFPVALASISIPVSVKTVLAPSYIPIVSDGPRGSSWGYRWLDNTGDKQNYCIYVPFEASSNWIVSSKEATGFRNAAPASVADCVPNM